MDDGSVKKDEKGVIKGYIFHTQGFSLSENKALAQILGRNFN
jgi:hypothetical protein